MPNWCSNSITIQGPTETLKPLWEEANREGSGLLNAIKPMPDALEGTTSPAPKEGTPQPLVDGHDNWYAWRLENWGTKWDIDVEEAGLEFTDNGDGTASISGGFQSAWAPPIEAYNTFLDDMDGCSLVADYHEPGMDFCGEYVDGDDNYYEGLDELIKGDAMKDDECFARLVEDYAIEEFYDDEEGIN
jgi:hypothetical protein|tara:strand:+ start:1200 stop:1763 length:564 start_codon:yes stop_codon:yes gene_type:complete